MKLKLIAVTLSFTLAACVSTQDKTQVKPNISVTPSATITPVINTETASSHNKTITLEQIMADPDWFGRAPESWYWGDDSNTVFYKQKQLGTPLRDLFVHALNSDEKFNS